MVGGMQSQWYQIPHPLGGQPTNWKIIMLQKFPHWSESSEPHIRLSSLREWKEELPAPPSPPPTLPHPRTWLWRTVEFGHRNYTGLGEKQTLPFEGEYNVSCPPISRGKKAVTSWESQTDLPAGIGGSPAEVGGGCGSLWGQRRWQHKFWEVLIGMSPPGGHC